MNLLPGYGPADDGDELPPPGAQETVAKVLAELREEHRYGRVVTIGDRLESVMKLVNHGVVQGLDPLLPVLFNLDGQPFSLADHEPFGPLYRFLMPSGSVWRTGRQVSKSTSNAAHSIGLSVCIPYLKTLFVTPLYEQIRRFSSNYVRPLIEHSPVREAFLGAHVDRSVLQRSFSNESMLLFSFAQLDAERIRGVSSDKVVFDESTRIGTLVETLAGPRAIETLQPGEPIWAVDQGGNLVRDEVAKCSDHGSRDCYRFEFANGYAVEVTSDSYLATTAGWKRAETIIRENYAACSHSITGANVPRDDARRCDVGMPAEPSRQSALLQPAQLEAEVLQLSKVPGVIRVRTLSTQEEEEFGLRKMVERMDNTQLSSALGYRFLVLPERQETRDSSLAGQADLGGRGLVVDGRRSATTTDGNFQHARLFKTRSPVASDLAGGERHRSQDQPSYQQAHRQTILDYQTDHGFDISVDREAQTLCDQQHDVQIPVADAIRHGDLSLLLRGVSDDSTEFTALWRDEASRSVLLEKRLPPPALQRSEGSLCAQTGEYHQAPQFPAGTLLQGFAGITGTSAGGGGGLPQETPRSRESQQKTTDQENANSTCITYLDMPALRHVRTAGRQRYAATVLSAVQGNRNAGTKANSSGKNNSDQAGGQFGEDAVVPGMRKDVSGQSGIGRSREVLQRRLSESSEPTTGERPLRCQESELVRITWTGRHRVFDIETKIYNTFFAGNICTHNCQDMDPNHFSVVSEAMSHSKWKIKTYTGTPKSLENTIEGLFNKSSMAEWWIPCYRCTTFGKPTWNIPSLEHHLLRMIGPYRDDISEQAPGTICFKCGKPINPRHGHWKHAYPSRRWDLAGYHVPQILLPLHFADPRAWRELTLKQEGWGNFSRSKFLNEVLGEGTDEGTKLVSKTELQRASSLPWVNDPRSPHPAAREALRNYQRRVLAVDWGGGGEEGVSFTVLAVMGQLPTGEVHCIWGKRLLTSADHYAEAQECLHWLKEFGCGALVHDYTGAGTVRETVLVQAGLNQDRLFPIRLARTASQALMVCHEPTAMNHRQFFSLDKARSLLYTCQAIKQELLKFFQYDFQSDDNKGLIEDFLALIEEKVETRMAGDIYTITRNAFLSDDFAQAVNLGLHALWHISEDYPSFVRSRSRFSLDENQLEAAGHAGYGWREDTQLGGFFDIP